MGEDREPPIDNRNQSTGRQENAAQPLDNAPDNKGAERYPAVSRDDGIEGRPTEGRSFADRTGNPAPPQGAGDGGPPPSANEGRLGPGADPAEGKR